MFSMIITVNPSVFITHEVRSLSQDTDLFLVSVEAGTERRGEVIPHRATTSLQGHFDRCFLAFF